MENMAKMPSPYFNDMGIGQRTPVSRNINHMQIVQIPQCCDYYHQQVNNIILTGAILMTRIASIMH